jgi:hypothetical protein
MKKNIIRIGLLIGMSFALCACSGVKQLGTVGNTKFYSVHSSHLFSPNYNFLVTSNETAVTVNQGFGGAPVSGQVVGAAIQGASVVGGAYMLGSHWPKPVGDNYSSSTSTSTSANGGNGNGGSGGNASNQATGGNGGNGGTGGNGGDGGFTPPGLVNNPGHTP